MKICATQIYVRMLKIVVLILILCLIVLYKCQKYFVAAVLVCGQSVFSGFFHYKFYLFLLFLGVVLCGYLCLFEFLYAHLNWCVSFLHLIFLPVMLLKYLSWKNHTTNWSLACSFALVFTWDLSFPASSSFAHVWLVRIRNDQWYVKNIRWCKFLYFICFVAGAM